MCSFVWFRESLFQHFRTRIPRKESKIWPSFYIWNLHKSYKLGSRLNIKIIQNRKVICHDSAYETSWKNSNGKLCLAQPRPQVSPFQLCRTIFRKLLTRGSHLGHFGKGIRKAPPRNTWEKVNGTLRCSTKKKKLLFAPPLIPFLPPWGIANSSTQTLHSQRLGTNPTAGRPTTTTNCHHSNSHWAETV